MSRPALRRFPHLDRHRLDDRLAVAWGVECLRVVLRQGDGPVPAHSHRHRHEVPSGDGNNHVVVDQRHARPEAPIEHHVHEGDVGRRSGGAAGAVDDQALGLHARYQCLVAPWVALRPPIGGGVLGVGGEKPQRTLLPARRKDVRNGILARHMIPVASDGALFSLWDGLAAGPGDGKRRVGSIHDGVRRSARLGHPV